MTIKTIATNRKAYHDYNILEKFEAGIVLTGTEIKSIRSGRVNLGQAFVKPERGEIWLINAHIARYESGSYMSHEPTRTRKLLLHRKEIRNLIAKTSEKGSTLVPLSLYIKGHVAKVQIALAKGKKQYDKRQAIIQRDAEREMDRTIKNRKRL
ncbi:MAG: SsrA-binding protein SmpB [Dehalococcoidales bacterium]